MTSASEDPDTIARPASNNRRLVLLAVAGALLGLLAGWLTIQFATGAWRLGPYEYQGILLPAPEPVSDFTLTTHRGQKAQLSDLRGQIAVLYFGYTYCPDVCPTTLATLSEAVSQLKPAEKEQVQVVMVTVDPARDTVDVLADYLTHFDPAFLGLTGSEEEIALAAEALGIYHQKGEGSPASGYLVDHTATVSVLDKEGRLRLLFPFGTPAEDIAADLQQLLRDN
ncbi:MAG: SCO family protein [Chloroflexota bacterium]